MATTYYINPESASPAWPFASSSAGAHNFSDLQTGLSNNTTDLADGDTIQVVATSTEIIETADINMRGSGGTVTILGDNANKPKVVFLFSGGAFNVANNSFNISDVNFMFDGAHNVADQTSIIVVSSPRRITLDRCIVQWRNASATLGINILIDLYYGNNIIRNSAIMNAKTYGIRVMDNTTNNNLECYDNVFYRCGWGGWGAGDMGNAGALTNHTQLHNIKAANNIVHGNGISNIQGFKDYFANATWVSNYNHFYGIAQALSLITITPGANDSYTTPQGDPLLIDPSTIDIHIDTGSPCINTGTSDTGTFPALTATDFYNGTRSGSWDKGAAEYVAGTTTTTTAGPTTTTTAGPTTTTTTAAPTTTTTAAPTTTTTAAPTTTTTTAAPTTTTTTAAPTTTTTTAAPTTTTTAAPTTTTTAAPTTTTTAAPTTTTTAAPTTTTTAAPTTTTTAAPTTTTTAGPTTTTTTGAPITPPTITVEPEDQSVDYGETATFSLTATGDAPLNYEWNNSSGPLVESAKFVGVDTNSLQVTGCDFSDQTADYYCIVTNGGGDDTSDVVNVTVNTDLAIDVEPTDQEEAYGASAEFSCEASSLAPITYKWYKDVNPLTDGVKYAGTSTDTLTISDLVLSDIDQYRCHVYDDNVSLYTAFKNLNVTHSIQIDTDPINVSTAEGEDAVFTVVASGNPAVTSYRWSRNGVPMSDGDHISGSMTDELTISGVTDFYQELTQGYSCTVENVIHDEDTSTQAKLDVLHLPVISVDVDAQTASPGDDITFEITATGDPTPTYQWQKDGVNVEDDEHTSGSTTDTLEINNVSEDDQGYYACLVTNSVGTVSSSLAFLDVKNLEFKSRLNFVTNMGNFNRVSRMIGSEGISAKIGSWVYVGSDGMVHNFAVNTPKTMCCMCLSAAGSDRYEGMGAAIGRVMTTDGPSGSIFSVGDDGFTGSPEVGEELVVSVNAGEVGRLRSKIGAVAGTYGVVARVLAVNYETRTLTCEMLSQVPTVIS